MAEAAATAELARRATERLRLPPHSVEAEQSLLGGLMLDQRAWDQIADVVTAEDLYRADHRLIFGAVAALVERNQPPDAVTVSEHLQRLGQLEAAGGLPYLARLVEDTPSAANIRAYGRIVRDHAMLRQLIEIGGDIAASAHATEGRTAAEIVDRAEQRVFEIAERGLAPRLRLRVVEASPAEDHRSTRFPESLDERDHRRVHGLRRDGQDDGGSATRRAHHHRGPAVHGQNDARDQHRGERCARPQDSGRDLQHGDVGRAALASAC